VVPATAACFISVTEFPENVVNVPAAWQLSHAADPIGTWLLGITTTTGVPLNVLPAAWQVAHPLVIPAWFIAVPGPNAVVDLWQLSHAAVVGMCPVPIGFGVTP
jgi:hypothetical protein